MPMYSFYDTKTKEYFDLEMTMEEVEEFDEKNSHINWLCGSPGYSKQTTMGMKPDEGFRDLLKTIKKGSPRSNINTF